MEKVYSSPMRNYLNRGFVMVSNLLIEYQQELGITELELSFIIKIMKHKNGFLIHDSELDSNVCSKTLSRRRNSLKEKGYLNFSIVKKQDENGRFMTAGISYDLSPLEEKLQMISDNLATKETKLIKETIEKENLIIEEAENSPIDDYKKDFQNCYGVPYVMNEYEIKKYNELSEENKKMISYIFNYCKDNDLIGKIVPRLSFFFKTKFRFLELRTYCINNGYINENINFETEVEKRSNKEDLTDLIETIYNNYNFNSYPFYRAVERLVYSHYKNGKLADGTDKLIEKAYISYQDNRRDL